MFRAQLQHVVIVRNVDERERLGGLARRRVEVVDAGARVRGVPRCPCRHWPGREAAQQRGGGPSGDDRVTAPAAAKAHIRARNRVNFNAGLGGDEGRPGAGAYSGS